MGQDEEGHFARYVTIPLILTCCSAAGYQEEDIPRQPDFEEHLEVQPSEHPWIQLCAHEEVVNVIASHPVLSTSVEGGNVSHDRDDESGDDGNGQERSKFVNDGIELKKSRGV